MMPTDHRAVLKEIRTFPSLVRYLRDEMDWPIDTDDFEELTFEYTSEELGIDTKNAAKIQEIKRLRPLTAGQPWGIFFVKFEPKRLPVVALRRILSRVVLKKRAAANKAERQAWAADDLLFVSNYGEGDNRQISFAHFSKTRASRDLPTLKVLGWNNLDTLLHLDAVAKELTRHLAWPEDDEDVEAWRRQWHSAFTLRHREVITTARDLSIRLAELARDIRDLIKTALTIETESGPLTKLMKAFREALVHDLDEAGFADMYAQTIAYGLLSARIANPKGETADELPAQMPVTNPFLKELMETFLDVGGRKGKAGKRPGLDFDELGVSEVVELLDDANMEAVVRDFGDRNPQEDPVIHFYEHFLKEYDKKQKMRRGVFYTPRPVVSFIVRSVDELLRTEFGLEDGLADITTWGEMAERIDDLEIPEGATPNQAFVQILDPATGTGTFLVEVIDLIHKTMTEKWQAEGHGKKKIEKLWNEYVSEHLLPRLHGYELMMAPYAIAHMKIGLKLYETGYSFGSNERARVYLTNSLEPPQDFSGQFASMIPALAHEAEAVNAIKRDQRFTVVIGNPPYSIQSQNLTATARAWVDAYRQVAGAPIVERNALQFEKNIQDDYVKFIRFSEVAITDSGQGVFGFVTSHGFLDGATFRGMRWSLIDTYSKLWVLDLHGNANKRQAAPDGTKDKNVFDISQGVAVSVLARIISENETINVHVADLWGERSGGKGGKYGWLLAHSSSDAPWKQIVPTEPLYLFQQSGGKVQKEYEFYPSLPEFMPLYSMGIKSCRDRLVLDFESRPLLSRIDRFRSASLSDEEACEEFGVPLKKGWNVAKARQGLREMKELTPLVAQFLYRPFDWRVLFYHKAVVFSAAYPVMRHLQAGINLALIVTRQTKDHWDVQCARTLIGHKSLGAYDANSVFPLYLSEAENGLSFGASSTANFSGTFLRRIQHMLNLAEVAPENVFRYAYATFHSPGYRRRYSDFLKTDFPRLPLPGSLDLFRHLSYLGTVLIDLHLLESLRFEDLTSTYEGPRNPSVGRVGWSDGTVWLDAGKTMARAGHRATQPGTIGFRGVSEEVWDYHIGGYQVCHKWLKDRKARKLTDEDLAHYQKIVFSLNETIRIMAKIDEVIEEHGGWPGAFQTAETKQESTTVAPFKPRLVKPTPEDRYLTCVPLVPLKAAAGAFSDPQHVEDDGWKWIAPETKRRLRPGMFISQVVGMSMEPAIPDGSYCLFTAPVTGTRQGKTVLAQLRDATDPETGERYTVKRYESEKTQKSDSWRHAKITLKPLNPDFEPIILTGTDEGELQVIAELMEVLGCIA